MHEADDPPTQSATEPRHELTFAFGIGTSFVGAALVVLAVTSSALLAALIFMLGVTVTIAILGRHRRHRRRSSRAAQLSPQFVEAVEQAIVDLRTEAEATQSVLQRAAERRLRLDSPVG